MIRFAFGRIALLAGIIILIQHISYSQVMKKTNYDALWNKVDSLSIKKGLTASALKEVNNIYSLAKKENNDAQLIKSLLYQLNLQETTTEDASEKSIQKLESEIKSLNQPSRSILSSLVAQSYWNYFQNNRYKFYNRTATVNFNKDDVATWSIDDFHRKISELYLQSLKEGELLQQTKLDAYDAIIVKGNARNLRPTLFDLLAHRAIDYFRNDERDINKPTYAFEINQAAAFDPAADFIHRKFPTKDSASLLHKALLIYQDLVRFHFNDKIPDALIDVDLQRIQFVRQHAVMENKEELYFMAINHVAHQYEQTPAASQAWYLLAQWYTDKASTYTPFKDTTHRFSYLKAIEICKKIALQKEETEGKVNCANLLQQIQRKELNLSTEKVNIPDQPFRTLVQYRNFGKLYFRLIAINDEFRKQLQNRYDDNYWKQLTGLKSQKTWTQTLPETNDYQKHSVEIKIDALPIGYYALLSSTNEDFSFSKNSLAVQYFHVSNISFINSENEYFALHRETGKPLEKATVQTWYSSYDYNVRKQTLSKGNKYEVDKNGYFKVTPPKEAKGDSQIEINYKGDRLFPDENIYSYYREEDKDDDDLEDAADFEEDKARIYYFTDRSIYRPGQTVYFKGIAITQDFKTRKSKVYNNIKTKIELEDANGEIIDSVELKTNEYGSISGKFKLPENTLNGSFTISDEQLDGEIEISVEEYKRPKFSVEYEKLKGTYRVNDSITITGLAKAYAGNNIDGAKVKYRVVREARFIYDWLYRGRGFMPRSSSMEIANGIAVTDKDGKYKITFKAIPDATLQKALDPVFDYKIISDVTDINGETRTGETNVSVSYKALQLKVSTPIGATIPSDSLKSLFISTQNMNGEFEKAKVKVEIYKLKSPDRLIRERYWQQPDQFVMSREEYLKYFPNDIYSDENEKENWEKGEKMVDQVDSSSANSKFNLQQSKFSVGWHIIEVSTKDKYGDSIKDVKYVLLYDEKSKQPPVQQYTWTMQKNSVIEPGEQSQITLGSSAKDLFVIQDLENLSTTNQLSNGAQNKKSTYTYLSINNEQKVLSFPATENDRGGFGVTHFFVKNNRFYVMSSQVSVPWTNKELTVSYETYRDKVLPGSEEKWKINVSGDKKEKLAAEMLGSMYDASLDQFKQHSWSMPNVWPNNYGIVRWTGNNCFAQIQSQEKYVNETIDHSFRQNYDALLTFESNRRRYMMRNAAPAADMLQGRVAGLEVAEYNMETKKSLTMASVSIRGNATTFTTNGELIVVDGVIVNSLSDVDPNDILEMLALKDAEAIALYGVQASKGVIIVNTKSGSKNKLKQTKIETRKNFNETAFFLPDLKTDSSGNISFSFIMPEALTQWKFQALAHTKDLAFGYSTKKIITQKELMLQPNAPRFLREGDRIELSSKVVNMSEKELTGTVQLELLNATNMQPVDGWFENMYPTQYFTAAAGGSSVVNFTIQIPYLFNGAVIYRFKAISGNYSDGEEAALPVVSNRMLVTESMPLNMRGTNTKSFKFEKLLQSGRSETLQHQAFTIEFTSNPAWYAVQALPYLTDFPYECAEQTFNRYYANALASMIANKAPKLKAIIEKWNTADTAALMSNLQKNQELKSILLQETPWVLEAKTEAQQKKNIALLFDMVRMNRDLASSFEKIKQMQSENGGFTWFKGGPDDRYITQYIMTSLGHLKKLGALTADQQKLWQPIQTKAIAYLDARINDDYKALLKSKADLKKNQLGYTAIQYLYMRSFYPTVGIPGTSLTAVSFYRKQSQQFWLQQNRYMQGMIALNLFRTGDIKTANDILRSLKENAIVNDEMGMYWKENKSGYYWYQAPTETQSLLIEAFSEISKDTKIVDDLKTWLLKQKQTQNWSTTKATADACYALLLQGSDWLQHQPTVKIVAGDKQINSSSEKQEAGTGYFKKTFDASFVNNSMGNIQVTVESDSKNTSSTWGAAYWQYFENLDKITPAATPLSLKKKLFIEQASDKGPILNPIAENALIKVGDKVKVRIELRVDRDMEYVHMKDMRGSCMAPVNVLSEYKWQGGLGYYESTKDASTNFFFHWLPKGTYVFEYALFASQSGNFSNGVTSIQCMYAPEFSSHSEGVRVNVEK